MESGGSDRTRFGPYEVDLHTHELWKHGVRLKLVGQPFEILAFMLSRPGQLVTREELRAELWPGDTFVDFNHGLNAAVNKLRDALCDSADDPKYIETLPRRGYRFIAPVERTGAETVPAKEPAEDREEPTLEARTVVAIEPVAAMVGQEPPSDVVPTPKPIPSATKPLLWLRYLVLTVALVLGLWQVANHLSGIWEKISAEREENGAKRRAEHGSSRWTPVTSLTDPTSEPALSPDGNHVAFRRESFVPGSSGIFVKQVGGEDLEQLTANENDCCPVWSPDGSAVAFSRFSDKERTIYTVSARGGAVLQVYSSGVGSKRGELDWSPDGKSIAFVGQSPRGTEAIFLLSVEDRTARQITSPPASERDWGPAFSPDGDQIAFVRGRGGELRGNIMVMPAEGGETRRLTSDLTHVTGTLAWAGDGQSIVFASTDSDSLWRIPAAGGESTPIREAGTLVSHPATSRRGFRLAYEQLSTARNIGQMDLYSAGGNARGLVTTATGENGGPQFSPDGKRLVFFSDRAGGQDIWISNKDGTNPVQLTSIGTAGAPRWSPDGRKIAFDVGLGLDWQQPRAIFVVNADGGTPRPLVQDRFNNPAPSWSRDGAWIYFPSDRTGDWQLWKVPAGGGAPVQVTTQGGFAAWESPDRYLYYAKHRFDRPEIWRVPLDGGSEAPVYPAVRPLDWGAWTMVEKGILFVEPGANDDPTLSFYDFAAQGVTHLAVLDRPPFWLGATPDAKSVVFDQPEKQESHIMLLENFR